MPLVILISANKKMVVTFKDKIVAYEKVTGFPGAHRLRGGRCIC